MTEKKCDFIVIGAGSGGVRASRIAASLGAKVKVIENSDLGGTCVNLGCVPKKLFVYASQYSESFRDSAGFGWSYGQTEFNWTHLREQKNKEIKRLNGIYENLLNSNEVDIIQGSGKIVSENQVEVNGETFDCEKILIATGSRPFIPQIPGHEHILSSNEMFHLENLPKKIVIVGGGYIAVEFASIMNGLGVETHLIYRGELFLRGFDEECRKLLCEEMKQKGIHIHLKTQVNSIHLESTQKSISLDTGESILADEIMYATGRIANTEGLGLENVNLETNNKGGIIVNESFQSNVPSIYAIGDVIDRVQLTPVAIKEGMWLAHHFYSEGFDESPPNYDLIPTAVFTQPNFATVGLTEEKAMEQYKNLDVYVSSFRPLKNTLSGNTERTTMKLLVETDQQKVVGAHMLGPEAGEIIQGLGVALMAGASKADFDKTVGIHPTSAEEFVTMREPTRKHRA